jgi:hypothetical protein
MKIRTESRIENREESRMEGRELAKEIEEGGRSREQNGMESRAEQNGAE